MALTDEQVEQFRTLYFKRFRKEINKEDAREQGLKLIRLMQLVYKPITEEQYNNSEKERLKIIESMINDGLFKKL